MGFGDGALVDWLEHRDVSRAGLRELLPATLLGAMSPASAPGHA